MKSKKLIFCLSLAGLLTGCAQGLSNKSTQTKLQPIILQSQVSSANGSLQTGRYQTAAIGANSSQINPLLTVATFRFAPDVQNVGQAINQVLQYSGYSLATPTSQEVTNTLQQPLPYSVRVLGPIEIKDALIVLMGQNVFTLIVDPLHRLVGFGEQPEIANALYLSRHTQSSSLLTK